MPFLVIMIKLNIYFIIFNKMIFFLPKIPKVSIFLPIFNKDSYLERSITSIQRQTLKDIEIIAVNDCSTDKTIKVLKKLSKKDKRIKIINNDRNHGLLYSRAMGIINTTGEYVMNLDPDDQILDDKDLESLYLKSKKLKLDMIKFLVKKIYMKHKYNNTFLNKRIKEIRNNSFDSKIPINREYPLITNKFIHKNIIIKAYNYFNKKIFDSKWNYHEDNIWHILINKYSNSKFYFKKCIYIYIKNKESLMVNRRNSVELKNLIYRFEIINKIFKIKSLKHLNKLLKKVNYYSFINIIQSDIEIKKKIINIIIHFLINYKSKSFLVKKDRYYIKTIYKNILNIFYINNKNVSLIKNYI